ncbi:MAG: hypothetical protein R3F02_02205 [Thiolinea sp.]
MIYRCRSCGSNATADLTCEYCGAGTRSYRKKRQQQTRQNPPDNLTYYAIAIALLVSSVAALLTMGVQS